MKSLTVELRDRAESYRQGGPSSEYTALLLEAAASKIEYLLSILEMEREQAEMMVEHLMLVLVPFAEMAYAEPDNAESLWKVDASYFRAAGNALSYASRHYPPQPIKGITQDEQ